MTVTRDDCPGVPLDSGLEPVADQDRYRQEWQRTQRELQPRLDAMRAARDRAAALAHNIAVTS